MKHTLFPALLSGTILSAAQPVIAQDQDTSDEARSGGWTPEGILVLGQSESYSVDQANVSRTPIPLIEVPQSIQVITSDLIEDQELVTLDEALRNVSGVVPSLPSELVLANPIVRGFEAEIFTDGLIGYGDTAVVDPGSLWNVERIEVAKGPTSTLFGGGTGSPVGGLINLVSKTANGQDILRGRARAGSFNSFSGALDLGTALSDEFSVRILGEYQAADDNIDLVEVERALVSASTRWTPTETTELVSRFTYSESDQLEYVGLPAIFQDDDQVDPERFVGSSNAPNTNVQNLTAQLEWTQELSDTVSFNLRGRRYESDFQEFSASPFFAFFPCGAASGLNDTSCFVFRGQLPTSVDEWTVDGSLTAEFATGAIEHVLLAGVQWDQTEYEAASGFDFFNVVPFDFVDPASDVDFGAVPALTNFLETDYDTFAVYIQDQVTIADTVHILASLRYSRLGIEETVGGAGNDEIYNEWDPRFGVTVDVAEGVSVFAGYATGSRLSLFFNGGTQNGASVNPLPERSESFEAGIKVGLSQIGLSGSLSAYRIDRTNVPNPLESNPLVSRQTGEQRSEGFEVDFILEPSPEFSLLVTYAFTDARVTEDTAIPLGDQLPRVPDHQARIAARYRIVEGAWSGFEVGAGLTAASDSVISLPNGAEVDGYVIADAQASYSFDQIRVGVRVDNLFNRDYFVPYQYFQQDVVRPGNPRSVFVTLGFEL